MELSDIINIVGITAYSLLAIFFLWVVKVPGNQIKIHYWLFSVLLMLCGRLDLYFLPAYFEQSQVQAIYAILLTLEKTFLILGLLHFLTNGKSNKKHKQISLFSLISLFGLFILYFSAGTSTYFLAWFSTTQAIWLIIFAALLTRYQEAWFIKMKYVCLTIVLIYAMHWLTFPIATNYPLWLTLGYLFGNALNLFVYLLIAYLVVYRFQHRMTDAEQSALALAEKANQASAAKSDFLANMSHEIRTPMNGVLSMLELLKQDQLEKEQKERVNIALNSGKNLLAIINDILDFSKIEAGKLKLEFVDFNLVELFEEVANSMKLSAQNKSLKFLLDTSEITIEHVTADPLRIKQILLNLTSNAIKFTPRGQVLIAAKTLKIDGQDHLQCDVKDTGIGINTHKLERIFSSFDQEDNSTTRNYGGTGLGLSISKQLCVLMKGSIDVTSTKNVGSCFSFAIPIKANEANTAQKNARNFSALSVMLVDDCQANLDITSRLLSSWKMNVTSAYSSKQAIDIAKHSEHFDCILVAESMPQYQDKPLIEQLKSLKSGIKSYYIVIEESIKEKTENQANINDSKHAFNSTITTPIIPSTLFNIFQKLIHKDPSSQAESDNLEIPDWPINTALLLVEDNRINQIVASKMLSQLNLTCNIVNNGAEAIEKLKTAEVTYSAILMDCQMPILDGYQATGKIREGAAGEHNQQTPILAMTANAMAGDREKCLAAGMDDYISKPLEQKDLLAMLTRWLIK